MKEKTILNKLKVLLGMEVKLEQMKLTDGITVIEADSFEPEMEVMIVAEDQRIPLPVGTYDLEDGRMLTVMVEGLIGTIEMPEMETEEEEVAVVLTVMVEGLIGTIEMPEMETEEEEVAVVEEEVVANAEPTPTPTAKKVIETSTKEMHFSAVDFENLQTENEELKTKLSTLELQLEEVSVKPISFNPENKNTVQIDLSKTDSKTRITNELNNLIK